MSALGRRFRSNSRLQFLALTAILVVGAAARVYVMARFEPAPGDGLLRASMAERWVHGLWPLDTTYVEYAHAGWEYMRLRLSGPWPPAHTVLGGLFVLIFEDPVFSVSLLSLLLGIMSIWVLYHITTKIFGVSVGLLSAATLALLPLHITLSTNPLTEVPAVFFVLAILAVTLKGMEAGFSASLLVALCVLTFVGTMIRYELWLAIPADFGGLLVRTTVGMAHFHGLHFRVYRAAAVDAFGLDTPWEPVRKLWPGTARCPHLGSHTGYCIYCP